MINGHEIPAVLVELIASGKWADFASSPQLQLAFPDADIVNPSFYEKDALQLENESWPNECDPAYLGATNPAVPPGDIDPSRSVLIADLGPDRPIALDYRTAESPRVIYLVEGDDANWIEAAPDIETLIERLSRKEVNQ